jgi:hypothetical protein
VSDRDASQALADFCLNDPRLVLVPIEHLGEHGVTVAFSHLLVSRCGWSDERVALLSRGLMLYWERCGALAQRSRTWLAPRRRHVCVVRDPGTARPYAQLLNTSAWTLYECDLDPRDSHPELVAYLLVLGDRMSHEREVSKAALHTAAWWFERADAECAAFAAAVARSTRPDAAALRSVADGLVWLRRLHHERLRPPLLAATDRPIPGTGLLVPRDIEEEPVGLVRCWREVAQQVLGAYHARWRHDDPASVAALCAWLAGEKPPLLVTGHAGAILWDPDRADAVDRLRAELMQADGVAVEAIHADLEVLARHTRAFRAALVASDLLVAPDPESAASGYCYLHAERCLLAYNLHEPGMERLQGPALPYARAMLGARAAHEWAHLADASGFVVCRATPEEYEELRRAFAAELDAVIGAAPASIRGRTAADLSALPRHESPGSSLSRAALARMPDYRANLISRGLMVPIERETYVRHNIRTLRPEYRPAQLWRMLVRYLFEFQYLGAHLGLTSLADPRTFLFESTWFVQDFLAAGVLDGERFDALAVSLARLCACHEVDQRRICLPA